MALAMSLGVGLYLCKNDNVPLANTVVNEPSYRFNPIKLMLWLNNYVNKLIIYYYRCFNTLFK